MGRKSGIKYWMKAVIAGMIVTKLAYFIPVVHVVAPLAGGSVTAYMLDNGAIDGMKGGFLKGIFMSIPAIILGIFFVDMLAGIPIIGDLLAGSLLLVVFVIVLHSVTLGMFSGFITGAIATTASKADPVETTAKTTATAANTVDDAKQTYSEKREEAEETYTENRSADSTSAGADNSGQGSTTTKNGGSSSGVTAAESNERPKQSSQNQESQPQSPSCTSCGANVKQGASFCPKCGVESPLTPATSSDDSNDSVVQKQCLDCDELIDETVGFCPECGTEDPFTPTPTSESAGRTHGHAAEGVETSTRSPTAGEQDSITSVANSVVDTHRPRSAVADELCQVLANEDVDEHRLEAALVDAVETIETATAVTDIVDRISEPTDRGQIESARESVHDESGKLPNALSSVLNGTLTVHDDLEECKTEYGGLEDAATELCNTIERQRDTQWRGGTITERIEQAGNAIESTEPMTTESPEPALSSVVDDVERSARPKSDRSRTLLETLRESEDDGETASVLRSTVEDLDEYTELHAAVADIGRRDVRRRLTSLDDELQQEEGAIYRHLADRIRELDAMVERDDIDTVQLYAIYQESTFYDRTLLPRLSRSDTGGSSTDVSRQLRTVEDRRTAIENDYVTVRADHNHTIPNHFLSLVGPLCDRARELDDEQPERAAGILMATDELLDGIEQLYERNEYSVMLRRLRG